VGRPERRRQQHVLRLASRAEGRAGVGARRTSRSGNAWADERPHRQRNPGDYDAITSQGRIVARGNDNLTSADVGVSIYRRQLRAGIRAVGRGEKPKGLDLNLTTPIPTYAYALVRPAPEAGTAEAEEQQVRALEKAVADDLLAFRLPKTPRVLEPTGRS
jgi:hypothetical protein